MKAIQLLSVQFIMTLQSDWNVKLDAGRYLAGDYGATFSLSRTFNNGWEIGAFATLTDVKFSTFGEGSFDKGITLKAPLILVYWKKITRLIEKLLLNQLLGTEERDLFDDDKFLYNNIIKI